MPEPKKPQDHKSKKATEPDEYFSFTAGGVEYTMPNKTLDVVNTKFVRVNRRRDETDYVFTCVEELAGDSTEILDAVDSLDRDGLKDFMDEFQKHLGASLGE